MSDQYYLHRNGNPCVTCGQENRESVVEIGYSRMGWTFRWCGWRTAEKSPFGVPVESAEDWYRILRDETDGGALIKSSYGSTLPLDDFLSKVDRKRRPDALGRIPLRHSELRSLYQTDCVATGADDILFS